MAKCFKLVEHFACLFINIFYEIMVLNGVLKIGQLL